jgi:hypothetical protein
MYPIHNMGEPVEVNMSNYSFTMLLDLIVEYGGDRFVTDRESLCGSWSAEDAAAIASLLEDILDELDPRDVPIEIEDVPGRPTVIGPNLNVAPTGYFGGNRRRQVEAAIEVLKLGAVSFG